MEYTNSKKHILLFVMLTPKLTFCIAFVGFAVVSNNLADEANRSPIKCHEHKLSSKFSGEIRFGNPM